MKNNWMLLSLALIPTLVWSHGPSRLKVTEEIAINAAPDKVWGIIKDFCSISNWHPDIAKCESPGGTAENTPRTLTLKKEGNPTIGEALMKYDEAAMSYKYKITQVDVKVLPVTTYSATITVKPGENNTTVVNWSGGFYRGEPRNNPPPELNDQAATTTVTAIYKAGLDNLKKLAEQQ